MCKKLVTGVVSLSFIASLFPLAPAVAAPHRDYDVKVTAVYDGDTIQADIDGETETVHIIGVDAPNRVSSKAKAQCFNKEAWDRAKKLVENSRVTLEEDPAVGNEDKDGHLLRHVFITDGRLFGMMMIRDGYARAIKAKKPTLYQGKYIANQTEAMNAKRGLWAVNKCNGLLIKK